MVASRPEPEWDDEQQGWMIALGVYRADLHTCGHPLSETTDPANENAYTADLPTRCHACTALDVKQQEYKDAQHPGALLWRAVKR